MERICLSEFGTCRGTLGFFRKEIPVVGPTSAIGIDDLNGPGVVDRAEEASPDHLCCFVIPCRVEIALGPDTLSSSEIAPARNSFSSANASMLLPSDRTANV